MINTWYVVLPESGSLFGFLVSSGLILNRAARVYPRIDPFIYQSQGHFLTPDNYRAQFLRERSHDSSISNRRKGSIEQMRANGFVIAEVCFRSFHVVQNGNRAHEAFRESP